MGFVSQHSAYLSSRPANKRSHESSSWSTSSTDNSEREMPTKKYHIRSPSESLLEPGGSRVAREDLPLPVAEHIDERYRQPIRNICLPSSSLSSSSSSSSLVDNDYTWHKSDDSIGPQSHCHHLNQQQQHQQLPHQHQLAMLPVVVEDSRVDDDDVVTCVDVQPPSGKLPKQNCSRREPSTVKLMLPTSHSPSSIPHAHVSRLDENSFPPQVNQTGQTRMIPGGVMHSVTSLRTPDQFSDGEQSVSINQPFYDDSDDGDRTKLVRKRERNKMAARKCRARKLDRISSLQSQCDYLREKNVALENEVKKLSKHIEMLKQTADYHVRSGCNIELQQLHQQHRWTAVVEHSSYPPTGINAHCMNNFI